MPTCSTSTICMVLLASCACNLYYDEQAGKHEQLLIEVMFFFSFLGE